MDMMVKNDILLRNLVVSMIGTGLWKEDPTHETNYGHRNNDQEIVVGVQHIHHIREGLVMVRANPEKPVARELLKRVAKRIADELSSNPPTFILNDQPYPHYKHSNKKMGKIQTN